MNLDRVKSAILLDKGMMQAADKGLRAKLLMDRAALEDLRENVMDRMPDLPWVRRTPKPSNIFQAVQFKVWDIEDSVSEVTEGTILPTWAWLRRSWSERPWAARTRRLPSMGFGHLAALLMGAAFGALAVYMVNTRLLNQNGIDTTVDEAMRKTEDAIGSRWNRPTSVGDPGAKMTAGTMPSSTTGPGLGQATQSGEWSASGGTGQTGSTGSVMAQSGRPDDALGKAGDRDIPRSEWDQFCEDFTRQHDRARLTVERGGETILRDQPLITLSLENSDGRPDFRIVIGDTTGERLAHVVEDVTRVQLITRGGGHDKGLHFYNADGVTTLQLQE